DQVNYDTAGEIHATFALPATAVPAGTQRVATVSFRTRSVPSDLNTALGLELVDVSAPSGDSITSGNAALGGTARILVRRIIGDNNANNRLDVGDATIIQRLLTGLDPVRSWDVTKNDVNVNTTLDSGDVIRVLRVVANIDPQPAAHTATGSGGGLAKAGISKAGPTSSELALLSSEPLRGQPGDLITVQVTLKDIATTISGASFTLDYPTNALRLVNAQSEQPGPIAANAVAVWNVQPAQNDFIVQNGRVVAALSSATPWVPNNGVLAEFLFQVQPGETTQYRWPIHLSGMELTSADGYDVRDLADSELFFIGRDPVPPSLTYTPPAAGTTGFSLTLTGETGVSYVIEASSDLNTWTPLATLTASNGTLNFTDPDAGNSSQRFYRAKQQ